MRVGDSMREIRYFIHRMPDGSEKYLQVRVDTRVLAVTHISAAEALKKSDGSVGWTVVNEKHAEG